MAHVDERKLEKDIDTLLTDQTEDEKEGVKKEEKENDVHEIPKEEKMIDQLTSSLSLDTTSPAAPLQLTPIPDVLRRKKFISEGNNNFENLKLRWKQQKRCFAITLAVIVVLLAIYMRYRAIPQNQIQVLGLTKTFPQKQCLSFFPFQTADTVVMDHFKLLSTSMHYHMDQMAMPGISAYHVNSRICLIAIALTNISHSSNAKGRLIVFMHDPELFALSADTRNIQEVDVICTGNSTTGANEPLIRKRSTSIQLRWKDQSGENFLSKFNEPESYLIQHLVDIVAGRYDCRQ